MRVITRSCVLFLWMQTLALVQSQDCTLEQFLKSRLFDSNFDTTDLEASYPGGKQVRVGCNVGYSGFFKLICVEGKWQSRGANCQPRSCGHPGDAQFADFHLASGDDFVFGSQVVYTCQKGYQMISRKNYRHCMAEGWDGVVPICEAQQCPAIHVDNNVQVIGDPEEATYGNVVRFSCKSNTEILTGSPEIYCDENGDWSDKAPKCEVIKCEAPVIEHGSVPGDIQEYKEHEVLNFVCDPKYRSTEQRLSKCTKLGIRAEWSPTPVCEKITCRVTLLEVEGTRFEPAFKNVFLPGETVRVICGEKYWISNPQDASAVITCKGDGEWTVRPVCQEVRCSNRRDPLVHSWSVYWGQQITLGETKSYSCKSGYRSTGGATRATCTRDGWTPNPLCEEITCNRRDIQNADIVQNKKQIYNYNEQASYTCEKGYRGSFTLTCREGGMTGRPQCTEVLCRKPDIVNGRLHSNDKRSYSHNEQVQYVCTDDGQRRFTGTCMEGVWTGIQGCTVTACPKPEVPHGFVVGPYEDTLYYTCDKGYKLPTKSWWGKAKCNDRTWTGRAQCIEETMCGDIPVIHNGKVASQRNVYGQDESAQIICAEGYRAQVDSLTCREGNWDSNGISPKAICTPIADNCKPPPKVENAVVATLYQKEYLSSSDVTYHCRDKYTMEGEGTIRCKDGRWEKKNIKCTPYCDKLKEESLTINSAVDKLRYSNGDVIEYQCIKPGVNTEGTATCDNGKWNKTVECEALSCDPPPADGGTTVTGLPENDGPILPDRFLTFSCDGPGKRLNNKSVVTCGKDGQWDNPFPSCEDITCNIGEIPPHLSVAEPPPAVQTIKIGHKLQLQCNNQYAPDESIEIECLQTGQWNAPFPTCSAHLDCEGPPPLTDGDTKETLKFHYRHGEKVEYTCQNYYVMEGQPYKTCNNGEWTGQMRCLRPCTVDREAMSTRYIAFKYTYDNKIYSEHNDEIEFRCIGRRRPYGTLNMRQTCLDGVIDLPTCQ